MGTKWHSGPCSACMLGRPPGMLGARDAGYSVHGAEWRREGHSPSAEGTASRRAGRGNSLLPQEVGEAQLATITQMFCAVKEMSSDSTKLLVSCRELRGSGRPGSGQEGRGPLSLGSPCVTKTPAQGLAGRPTRPEGGRGWGEVTPVRGAA